MKKNTLILIVLAMGIILSGCSAKYEVRKNYDKSEMSRQSIEHCESKEEKCQAKVADTRNDCLKGARARAEELIYQYDQEYRYEYSIYQMKKRTYDKEYDLWLREFNNYQYDFDYFKRKCKKKGTLACEQKEYFKSKMKRVKSHEPVAPEMTERKSSIDFIQDEQRTCNFSFNCKDIYDKCFEVSGGKIIHQKFCISNCD